MYSNVTSVLSHFEKSNNIKHIPHSNVCFNFFNFLQTRLSFLRSFSLIFTESEWLKWWNEVGVFQTTSTTTGGPQVTSTWNGNVSVATDDQKTQSSSITTKWNTSITDIATRQLTSALHCIHCQVQLSQSLKIFFCSAIICGLSSVVI